MPASGVAPVSTAAVSIPAALVVLALGLMVELGSSPVTALDRIVDDAIAGWASADDTAFWVAVTTLGDGAVLSTVGVLGAAVLAWRRRWADAAGLLAAMVAVFAIWISIRLGVARPRPVGADALTASDVGFPSGHASNSMTFAVLAVLVLGPWLGRAARVVLVLAAALFTLAVGVSRLVLGVHYASDVLAGWALGLAVAPVAFVLVRDAVRRSRGLSPG